MADGRSHEHALRRPPALHLGRGALRPGLPHGRHRGVQLGQPVPLVLGDQAHAPGERIRPRAGHAGLDEGVEHPPLRLLQPGHDGHGEPGEDLAGRPAGDAPGDLAAGAALELAGDLDAGAPGVLAEPGDPARLGVGGVGALGGGDGAVDEDLLAVDGHLDGGEPVGRQPPVSQSLTLNVPWSVVM